MPTRNSSWTSELIVGDTGKSVGMSPDDHEVGRRHEIEHLPALVASSVPVDDLDLGTAEALIIEHAAGPASTSSSVASTSILMCVGNGCRPSRD